MKITSAKQTDPGAHQVFHTESCDVISLREERCEGEPLLLPVMRGGAVSAELPSLEQIRARCRERVAALPPPVRDIRDPKPWPVERSPELRALRDRLLREGVHRRGVLA